MFQIQIKQWPTSINAGTDSILQSVLDGGVPFPHQCRTGDCGSCCSKLVSGEIKHDDCSEHALSRWQKEAGWILPCRAKALSDVQLDCPGDWANSALPPRNWRARVESLKYIAERVVHLQLRCRGTRPVFYPGQYFQLAISGLPARAYSPANSPNAELLELYISVHNSGLVSSHIAKHLRCGDPVRLRGPFGRQFQISTENAPVFGIATGTGLAPLLSILRSQDQRASLPKFRLIVQSRSRESVFAGEILKEMQVRNSLFSFHQTIPPPDCSDTIEHLLIQIRKEIPDEFTARRWRYYLAGSPKAVERCCDLLHRRRVNPDAIQTDSFVASSAGAPSELSRWISPVKAGLGRWFNF